MSKPLLVLLFVALVSALNAALQAQAPDFQVNQTAATLRLDGLEGDANRSLFVHLDSCEAGVLTVASDPALVGQPFNVAFAFALPLPAGAGGFVTPNQQVLHFAPFESSFLFPSSSLPSWTGDFAVPVENPTSVPFTIQFAILNPMHPDGFSLSAPVTLGGATTAGTLIFNHPCLLIGPDCEVSDHIGQASRSGGINGTFAHASGTPSGLARDAQDNVYFGNIQYVPYRVEVLRRAPDGTQSSLGTLVNGAGGNLNIGGWGFDLAVRGNELIYTHPTITGVTAGFIGSIDLVTGSTSTLVSGLFNPSGLAVDGSGNIYFGNLTYSPQRVELMRLAPGGVVTSLGIVVDATGAGLAGGGWGFDLALLGSLLLFTHPEFIGSSPGFIGSYDLGSGAVGILVGGLNNPSGLAFDNTDLYFGNVSQGPFTIELMRFDSGGQLTTLGTAIDGSGAGIAFGGWAFDLEFPCN